MNVNISVFHIPKRGHAPQENEDAFAIRVVGDVQQSKVYSRDRAFTEIGADLTTSSLYVALSDGATESSFSRQWAQILARFWTRHPRICEVENLRERCTARWERAIGRRKKELPWYAEAKLEEGAASALLMFSLPRFSQNGDCKWESAAIGDVCLFQLRENTIIHSFPLDKPSDFSDRPFLLTTFPKNESHIHSKKTYGVVERGDAFLFATDAMAGWIVSGDMDQVTTNLKRIRDVADESSFRDLVDEERKKRFSDPAIGMKNDDVTMVHCKISD
jgi:hypothetical protein